MLFRKRTKQIIKHKFHKKNLKNSNFDTIFDVVVSSCTVFLRCDFNVPIKNGIIQDDTRIRSSLETIEYLTKNGAKVVIGTHLGRPKGKYDMTLSTKPIAEWLERNIRSNVYFAPNCIGNTTKQLIHKAEYGDIIVLENLRFHKEEESCDLTFAAQLADGMNLYINDAFGCSHRSHASILGIPLFVYSVAGCNMIKEIDGVEKVIKDQTNKKMAIIGGSKISTKIDILKNLVTKVETLVLGGGMANTFLLSQGYNIGQSIVEKDFIDTANQIIEIAKQNNCLLIIPKKVIVAKEINSQTNIREINIENIEEDEIILDISPNFIKELKKEIKSKEIIILNGPIGMFEIEQFANGTKELINLVGDLTKNKDIISIAAGGDSVAAINKYKRFKDFSFISMGGGAFLEAIEERVLPGIEVLKIVKNNKLD